MIKEIAEGSLKASARGAGGLAKNVGKGVIVGSTLRARPEGIGAGAVVWGLGEVAQRYGKSKSSSE